MAALADAVPLERWRRIVEATATLAEEGDAKAREWLARHLLGDRPPSLAAVAAEVAEGVAIGDTELLANIVSRRGDDRHRQLIDGFECERAERILAALERHGQPTRERPADPGGSGNHYGLSQANSPGNGQEANDTQKLT
jgi:hypothetical protein